MNAPTLSLPEISLAIADAQSRRAALSLPNLSELRGRVNYLTSQTIFDPARKGDLQAAMHTLDAATREHEKAKQIDLELLSLQDKLQQAEYENAQAKREQAKRVQQDALTEFRSAALATCRAARRCMKLGIDPGQFHFAFLSGAWNSNFTTKDEMGFGLLRFEQSEKEQAIQ